MTAGSRRAGARVAHALQSAEAARRNQALDLAERYYRLADAGATNADDATRMALLEGLADVLHMRAKPAEAERSYMRAQAFAATRLDRARLEGRQGEMVLRMGHVHRRAPGHALRASPDAACARRGGSFPGMAGGRPRCRRRGGPATDTRGVGACCRRRSPGEPVAGGPLPAHSGSGACHRLGAHLGCGPLVRLETANSRLQRLARLVEDLFDVSRLAQGRVPMHRAEVDLAALTAEAVDRWKDELAGHISVESTRGQGATFTVELPLAWTRGVTDMPHPTRRRMTAPPER